jgi:hypothetical protein
VTARITVRFLATSALVVGLAASCGRRDVTVGPEPPPSTSDGITTVALRADPDVLYEPDQVLSQLATACGGERRQVRLDLRQGDAQVVHVFDCVTVRRRRAASTAELLGLVSGRHDATARADRVNAVAAQLGVHPYSHDDMVWSIGTGVSRCSPLRDDAFYRQEIESARRNHGEDPEQWTKVEVAWRVGVCPTQIAAFLTTVEHLGQPAAAAAVRADLARIELPGN